MNRGVPRTFGELVIVNRLHEISHGQESSTTPATVKTAKFSTCPFLLPIRPDAIPHDPGHHWQGPKGYKTLRPSEEITHRYTLRV